MLRQILAITGLMLTAGLAQAEDTVNTAIANSQDCFAVVDGLAQSWENHKYASKPEADKIGDALKKLEKLCEGEKFADAQKSASDLKALISH